MQHFNAGLVTPKRFREDSERGPGMMGSTSRPREGRQWAGTSDPEQGCTPHTHTHLCAVLGCTARSLPTGGLPLSAGRHPALGSSVPSRSL
eukprot:NODE_162_length_1280_cov_519.291633_g126_i0.p1 GENE.NODE_162_length_1280_cov_519.291633_g126_i0~~NODE_162_length_1280_cov_519.291633_g126_i0.p1  ORF type:complete len:91 (+),score=14.33 NODE_162_length_1280_cov_519.291633_g126_i0:403-675(+)